MDYNEARTQHIEIALKCDLPEVRSLVMESSATYSDRIDFNDAYMCILNNEVKIRVSTFRCFPEQTAANDIGNKIRDLRRLLLKN
jgi:hypothetical protein